MTPLNPAEHALLLACIDHRLASMRPAQMVQCDEYHAHHQDCLVSDEQAAEERRPLVELRAKVDTQTTPPSQLTATATTATLSIDREDLLSRLLTRLEGVFLNEVAQQARRSVALWLEEASFREGVRQTIRAEVARHLATMSLDAVVEQIATRGFIESRVCYALDRATETQAAKAVEGALEARRADITRRLDAAQAAAAAAFGESMTKALAARDSAEGEES